MNTNAIPLKKKLDFHQYLKLMKVLEKMGIEVDDSIGEDDDFYYELTPQEIESIELSRQQIAEGAYKSSSEVHRKIEEKYGITLDR